jgi:hypothetical protein
VASDLGVCCHCMSAVAGWYQGVRRLVLALPVIRNGAETVMPDPCGRSERTEGVACEVPPHRLAGVVPMGPHYGALGRGHLAVARCPQPGRWILRASGVHRPRLRDGRGGLGFVAALQAFSMAYGAKDRLMGPGALPAISVIGPLEGLVMAAELPALLPNHAAIPRWAAALAALATRSPLHPRRPGPCRSC